MKLVELSARQPISIIVGILFTFLTGLVAIRMVAVEMAPEVEETIIAVNTSWENASPQEIESEVVDPQEEKLQSLSNLASITSMSSQGGGLIRLEFNHGVDKDIALRDVSDKLREVPNYPFGVDEPVIEATDPESQDYIAWFLLRCDDPNFDVRQLQSFAEDHLKPILERIPGMSEVNVLGGIEREVQISIDQEKLSQHGITLTQLVQQLRDSNTNASAGALTLGKLDIRLRSVGRFSSPESVLSLVLRNEPLSGPVRVRDVATIKESFKEPSSFVRASGERCLAFNFQREPGTNVLEVMDLLKATVDEFNQEGNVLDSEAKRLGLSGGLEMKLSYDATRYVRQALVQVQNNIYIGGALAVIVLLLFLRSLRSLGIIAISIPVSMVGAVILMVAMGRTVNVISLAGIAFAVGMVVDNSIVVLENIYRHLEMGKGKLKAAVEGTSEVAGAVLASSLTTLIVFIPILLITDQVGQLFRDISLSIMTSVGVSYLVAITVIPSAGAKILNEKRYQNQSSEEKVTWFESLLVLILKSTILKILIVVVLAVGSIGGSMALMPPMDYLPKGNRNITFGLMLPPPGLNLEQLETMGQRVEETVRPYWEKQKDRPPVPEPYTGREVYPTDLSEYFLVSPGGILFHGGISTDDRHAVDNVALLQHASRQDVLPGVFSFAFQFPLFRLGGSTGSAVKINLVGRDLNQVSGAAGALFMELMKAYGPGAARPDPSNFNLKAQEVQLRFDEAAIAKAGLTRRDVILAMQASGDGIFLGEYEFQGDLVDLKLWSAESQKEGSITQLENAPVVAPDGQILRLGQLAKVVWTEAAEKIKRVGRRRAVTLEFTAPPGLPLEQVVSNLEGTIAQLKTTGGIPPSVNTELEGSAGKLSDIRNALLGDGTLVGLMSSSMFTSFVAVYLLMCILFQSWLKPLVIMFTVPLATFGGFLGLFLVHSWSLSDPYMPVQNLDVLTLLGFVILSGVVVNNAILIVAQADIIIKEGKLPLAEAIAKASQSRVRPIFMSLLTSVGGMLPLILNPGSGSELYRGLGAVVVGGMLLSTIFTLVLIPILMMFIERFRSKVLPASLTTMVLMSSLVLSGCQLHEEIPTSNLQESDLPAGYLRPSVDSGDFDFKVWRSHMEDANLDQLIAQALDQNLSVEVLEKRLEKVLALHQMTKADLYPHLSAEFSAEREKNPYFRIPNQTQLFAGFNVQWTLDWLGRVRDQKNMAMGEVDLAKDQLAQHRFDLALQVSSSYLAFRDAQQKLKNWESILEVKRQRLVWQQQLEAFGRQDASVSAREKLSLHEVEQQLVMFKEQVEQQRLLLESWVGVSPAELKGSLESSSFTLSNIAPMPTGLPADLLRRRQDVREAETRVLIAASALKLSQKEIYPRLQLLGSLNFFGQRLDSWFTYQSSGFSIGPQLSWRIFEFGKIKSEQKAAAADYDAAVLSWRQTLRLAVQDVEQQLQHLQAQGQKQIHRQQSASLAEQEEQRAQMLFEHGRRNLGDVQLAQIQSIEMRVAKVSEAFMTLQAQLKVISALGGL